MRLWREAVFARDNWTCQKCKIMGGELNPHHIKNFAECPELRTSIENGITLCEKCLKDLVTVLVSTSPIKSHPDTSIIEKTVESIRKKLPENEIFIMIDGIRNEQEYLRENYQEYIRRLLWLCNHKWSNVLPIVFPEFRHQQGITKETIKMVNTPTILLKKDGAIE